MLGVDVARSIAGDLNAIAVAHGGRLLRLLTWHEPDTMKVVARVVTEATTLGPSEIRVDVGGPGGGVVDRLRQLDRYVEAVYFGGAPEDRQRFANKRAELYWRLRESLERGEASLPDDDELVADLASIRYFIRADGRIQIEAKDEVRSDSAAARTERTRSRSRSPAEQV